MIIWMLEYRSNEDGRIVSVPYGLFSEKEKAIKFIKGYLELQLSGNIKVDGENYWFWLTPENLDPYDSADPWVDADVLILEQEPRCYDKFGNVSNYQPPKFGDELEDAIVEDYNRDHPFSFDAATVYDHNYEDCLV